MIKEALALRYEVTNIHEVGIKSTVRHHLARESGLVVLEQQYLLSCRKTAVYKCTVLHHLIIKVT